jgi:transposase
MRPPIRVGPGPKTRKRYLLVACTSLLSYFFLGDRSAKTFAAFVFPDLEHAVVVHDRYQNYDAFPGVIHQLCSAHIVRDLKDAAEAYPRRGAADRPVDGAGPVHAATVRRSPRVPPSWAPGSAR